MASEAAAADGSQPKDPIACIAKQVAYLSTGDRAQLRRIYLTRRYEADGIVLGLLHRAGVSLPDSAAAFAPWRLLAHVAALLSGTAGDQPHASGRRLGAALQAAGYSENRLLRLTAARGTGLEDQIIRAVRMLAQTGQVPVNLWTLFDLAGRNPGRAEQARIRIAQDYYAAAARSGEGSSQ